MVRVIKQLLDLYELLLVHIQTVVSCMYQLVKVLHLVVQLVIQGLPYIYLGEKREQVVIMEMYISEMEQLSLCILMQ